MFATKTNVMSTKLKSKSKLVNFSVSLNFHQSHLEIPNVQVCDNLNLTFKDFLHFETLT